MTARRHMDMGGGGRAVRPLNVICHWSAAPVSDLVAVPVNVPSEPDTLPDGAGTSDEAFIDAIRPIVVAWPRVGAGGDGEREPEQ